MVKAAQTAVWAAFTTSLVRARELSLREHALESRVGHGDAAADQQCRMPSTMPAMAAGLRPWEETPAFLSSAGDIYSRAQTSPAFLGIPWHYWFFLAVSKQKPNYQIAAESYPNKGEEASFGTSSTRFLVSLAPPSQRACTFFAPKADP